MPLLSCLAKRFLPGLIFFMVVPAQAQTFIPETRPVMALTQAEGKALETRAINLLELARRGQYAAVRKEFSPALAQGTTDAFVKQRWEQVIAITGPVQKFGDARVLPTVNANLVFVKTEFTKVTDDIIVTFNQKGEIVGVNFPNVASIESIAEQVVLAIDEQNVAQVRTYLHPFLKTEIYPQDLQKRWDGLERQHGQFKRITDRHIKPNLVEDGIAIVILTVEFEKATKDIFIIFDNQAQITGIDLTR